MIVFVNVFDVTGPAEEFEAAFDRTSAYFCRRPGFLRHRLVRDTRNPATFINIAEWEDAESFQRALRQPEFGPHAAALRELATSESHVCAPLLERVPTAGS